MHPDRAVLIRVCKEFGCLPRDVEDLSAMEFVELVAYLKMQDDAEKKAIEKSKAESRASPRMRRR